MEGEVGILTLEYLTPYWKCVTYMPNRLLTEVDMEKKGSLWELCLWVVNEKEECTWTCFLWSVLNQWVAGRDILRRNDCGGWKIIYFGSDKFNPASHYAKINMLPTPWVKIFDEIIIIVSCLLPFQMSPLQCEKSFRIYPLITLNFSLKLRWYGVLLWKPQWVSRTHFKLSHSTVILRWGHN